MRKSNKALGSGSPPWVCFCGVRLSEARGRMLTGLSVETGIVVARVALTGAAMFACLSLAHLQAVKLLAVCLR